MSSPVAKLITLFAIAAAFLLAPAAALAAPVVDGIFPLGSELSANNKIVAGSDGNVWLTVEDGTNDVARVTPGGQVQEFDIGEIESPVGIASGPEGKLWIADVEKAASFAPGDPAGSEETFAIPDIGAENQIVAGPDGFIWVASNNNLVRFRPDAPEGTDQKVAVNGNLAPKDIDVAGGLVVIADSAESRIVSFTAAGVQQDFPIASASQGVAGGPGGQIAYSAPLATPEQVGLITPPNPAASIPVPGDPFGVDLGSDGAYWVVQFAEAGLTRFTPAGQTTFLGGLPDESARQITAGPGNTLWVTLTKTGEPGVARISGVDPEVNTPPPPPPPVPQTKIFKGPKKVVKTRKKKARVKFRFSSPSPEATFQCWLTRSSKKSRSAVLRFKPCKSPRVYRLRPGKYQFSVRAVVDGVPDPTPAVRKFKIKRIR